MNVVRADSPSALKTGELLKAETALDFNDIRLGR
jgi:hypothetical protein